MGSFLTALLGAFKFELDEADVRLFLNSAHRGNARLSLKIVASIASSAAMDASAVAASLLSFGASITGPTPIRT